MGIHLLPWDLLHGPIISDHYAHEELVFLWRLLHAQDDDLLYLGGRGVSNCLLGPLQEEPYGEDVLGSTVVKLPGYLLGPVGGVQGGHGQPSSNTAKECWGQQINYIKTTVYGRGEI